MKRLLLTLLLFCVVASPGHAATVAGQVVELKGAVFISGPGKSPAQAQFKQPVHVGDVIETKEGTAKILFVDDTVLTLKEKSKTLVSQFLFNEKAKKRSTVLEVPFGKVRTVVGKFFGEKEAVEIKTPTAVAGIRGTDVGALVGLKATTFYCFDGKFAASNVKMPDQMVEVGKGMSIQVMQDIPVTPENVVPFSADVEKGFEASMSKSGESKGSAATSSSEKMVQETKKAVTTEAPKATEPQAAQSSSSSSSPSSSSLDSMAKTSEQESQTQDISPAQSTEEGIQTLPGGVTETTGGGTTSSGGGSSGSSDTTTITIDFP